MRSRGGYRMRRRCARSNSHRRAIARHCLRIGRCGAQSAPPVMRPWSGWRPAVVVAGDPAVHANVVPAPANRQRVGDRRAVATDVRRHCAGFLLRTTAARCRSTGPTPGNRCPATGTDASSNLRWRRKSTGFHVRHRCPAGPGPAPAQPATSPVAHRRHQPDTGTAPCRDRPTAAVATQALATTQP